MAGPSAGRPEAPAPEGKRAAGARLRIVLFLAGALLALYLLREHAGPLKESLRRVGWGLALYLLASGLVYALDTWAWRIVFVPGQPAVGFGRLFGVRMAGEAANKITPFASLGGEPVKAFLLTRSGCRLQDGLASVAIAKHVMTLAQIAFIFLGVTLSLLLASGHRALLLGLALFPAAILGAILVTAVLDWRLRRSRSPDGGDPGSESRRPGRAVALWAQVADFFWVNPRGFWFSFLLFFLGWAAGALELLAGAWALGLDLNPWEALALEALLSSVTMATFFIPANVGSQEGGFTVLSPLFGIAPADGMALAVLRRCRDVVWVAFGLVYMLTTEGRILFQPGDAQ